MPWIIVIILLAFIAYRIWRVVGNSNDLTINFNPHIKLFRNRLSLDQVNILSRYSNYYRKLPEKLKSYYEDRLVSFMEDKEFLTRGELTLTEEMRLLIADSAVKLTFGLRIFMFEQFEKIIIFKSEFFSDFSHSKNKGETNPAGAIVFSWKDLVEGDLDESDGINLGLHEFAHALMIQNLGPQGWDDQYFTEEITHFDSFYENRSVLADVRKHHFFRDYAFRNKMEFFAVAVEHFFERPAAFNRDMPDLYRIMCQMLNQNPAILYPLEKPVVAVSLSKEAQCDPDDDANSDQPHQS